MGKDDLTKLKKENDELKVQLGELRNELMAFKEKINSSPSNGELLKSVTFVSDELDNIQANDKVIKDLQTDLQKLEIKLLSFENNVIRINETIEALHQYSFQYNLKILGVPSNSEGRRETDTETIDICLKLFKELKVKVDENDIDIAHRSPSKKKSKYPDPIICKFTRRIVKEAVLKQKKSVNDIDLTKFGLNPPQDQKHRILILEHLTPWQQDLFSTAKDFKQQYNFKFCWIKNQTILLREDEESNVIRIKCLQDLMNLRDDFCTTSTWPPFDNLPPPVFESNHDGSSRGSHLNGRGITRGQRGHRGQRGSSTTRITRSMTSFS